MLVAELGHFSARTRYAELPTSVVEAVKLASIFQYTDANLADPEISALMQRIRVEVDTALDAGYPERRPAFARIVLKDGREFEGHIDNAKGEPEYPVSAADIEEKFLTLARDVLPGGGTEARDLVLALDKLESISELSRALGAHRVG